MVLKDDDRHLGTRAGHFVLVYGWTESKDLFGDCAAVMSNHKGRLTNIVCRFVDKEPAQPQGGQSSE
ncbi:MAG: hypothetical protein LBO05_10570 [Deltaproteobacteria bacterium]|jgi:hypothetical protein|nr:hypothetical protein [Deltaproteobacteria bacterium]